MSLAVALDFARLQGRHGILMKTYTKEQFQKWGKRGGSKKGKTKVRGNSEYYRNISKK